MGEYFNGVKLGTCTHLMYISREELEELAGGTENIRNPLQPEHSDHPSLSAWLSLKPGFLYRFPRKKEQAQMLKQIVGRQPFDYIRLELKNGFKALHKDFSQVQITIPGLNRVPVTYNMKFCLLDTAHFDLACPTQYGGWDRPAQEIAPTIIEIVGNRYTEDHPNGYTVFRCPCCDQRFSCNSQEIEDYIKPALVERGMEYEAQFVRPYIEV